MEKKVVWDWLARDPRNMIGDAVVDGRDAKYRSRAVEHCRVGDSINYFTLTRTIRPV